MSYYNAQTIVPTPFPMGSMLQFRSGKLQKKNMNSLNFIKRGTTISIYYLDFCSSNKKKHLSKTPDKNNKTKIAA